MMAMWHHPVGLDEVHISLSGGGTFFFLPVGAYGVPSSSEQPSPARGNSLRGEKKKQTSRRNLRVRWVFHEMPTAAIVFSRQRLSGYALLDLIQ